MPNNKPENKKLRAYKSNSTLDFGKYKGKNLEKIIFDNPKYIVHCINQENHFCIECELLTLIETSIYRWTFIVNMYKLSLIEERKKLKKERNTELITTLYANMFLGICNENTDNIEF